MWCAGGPRARAAPVLGSSEVTGRRAGGRCGEAAGKMREIRAISLREHCATGCPSAARSISFTQRKDVCKRKWHSQKRCCFVPGILQSEQKYVAARSLPVICHFLCLETRKGNSISHKDKWFEICFRAQNQANKKYQRHWRSLSWKSSTAYAAAESLALQLMRCDWLLLL